MPEMHRDGRRLACDPLCVSGSADLWQRINGAAGDPRLVLVPVSPTRDSGLFHVSPPLRIIPSKQK